MKVDVDLVGAAKLGDADSFCQLYETVSPQLYKLALYTLGNSHDAEDVVSETFVEAYKGIGKLRDDNAFKPWIIKILNIRCKRKIGEYIRGKTTYDIEQFTNLPVEEEELSEAQSDKLTVLSAMSQLAFQDRTIVILSVLHGYTTKEIAEMLSCPHGTVSSKLYRALQKLRKLVETQ